MDRNTLLIWTNRFSLNSEVEQEWYILRVGKGVLFREVFSVQVCYFYSCEILSQNISCVSIT